MEFSERGKPLQESDVAALESELTIALPAQYRQFLLLHNGGIPAQREFVFRSGPYGDSEIDRFLSIDNAAPRNLRSVFVDFKATDPSSADAAIPIADDFAGNFVCIGIKGEDAGRIYFSDHEEPDTLTFIAPSFNEFLETLQPPPPFEPKPRAAWMDTPNPPEPVVQLTLWEEDGAD